MAQYNTLEKTLLDKIRCLDITELNRFSEENATKLHDLIKNGKISDNYIEDRLEKAIVRQARKDYDMMMSKSYILYADHVNRPDCLAYAIRKGEFTSQELEKIHLDHELTIDMFALRYGKGNLIATLKHRLLFPPDKYKENDTFDPHPACCRHL